jgi:hypothetical protein
MLEQRQLDLDGMIADAVLGDEAERRVGGEPPRGFAVDANFAQRCLVLTDIRDGDSRRPPL